MNTGLLHHSIYSAALASFSRSGGPGGQNVNKVNTKVTLRVRLEELDGLNEAEIKRMGETLAHRVTGDGELVVTADEERSQHTNLQRAYARMESIIVNAARLPRQRRPTKPSRAAREERLRSKRRMGEKKAARRFTPEE
jgi:ribosome-associated protein